SYLGMKKFITIAILASSVLPAAHSSLLNLKSMVEANTGRNAILSFVGYSCYCRGWCCHAHDCCYQKLFDLGCHTYGDHYDYTIENNTNVVCSESLSHHRPFPQESVTVVSPASRSFLNSPLDLRVSGLQVASVPCLAPPSAFVQRQP
ncbi:hypothetical protein E2I00_002779, partial [Balaenoptera physalus]